ncbi:hypothetical protein TNCV_1671341 [Trichonephila clavipes]|nr:hypothetical protein TNCV_1671341 [Trichonephila clavipes]
MILLSSSVNTIAIKSVIHDRRLSHHWWQKSLWFPVNTHDNSQHRVLRSEAELVYESDDVMSLFQEQKLTVL